MDKQQPQSSPIKEQEQIKAQKQEQKDPASVYDGKKRYKRCCLKCKHTQKGKRSCVCVVPMGQRRTEIGNTGCQTCGCGGCSIQDYVSRGEDPEFKPQQNRHHNDDDFQARNGCCKNCMKAFSKSNKSCLCQVPREVRKSQLPASGCKVCNCQGCHPQDKKQRSRQRSRQSSQRGYKHKKRRYRDNSPSYSSSSQSYNKPNQNLQNMDKSLIGLAISQAGLYAPMLGLGIPQRTYSYILGKAPPK